MNRLGKYLLLAGVFAIIPQGAAFAARYVPIEVSVQDTVILKGNASDDGRRDEDELWNALKQADLRETSAFTSLTFERKGDLFRITGRTDRSITVSVRYGGVAKTRRIVLRLMSSGSDGRVWRIDAEDVDKLFHDRTRWADR